MKAEPLTFDKRLRKEEVPVGLKNVGNTCYFNSFIQAFFFLPNMTQKLLSANIKKQKVPGNPADNSKTTRAEIST